MAISLVSATSATSRDAGGPSVATPGDTSTGDRMLAFVAHANVVNEPITPSGWRLLATSWGSTAGGSQQLSAYTKRATSEDLGSSTSFPFVNSGTTKSAAVILTYTGDEGLVELRGFLITPYSGSNAWEIPVPDLNVAEVPSTVVMAGSYKASPGEDLSLTAAPPAGSIGWEQISTVGGGSAAVATADKSVTTSGIQELGSFTWSSNDSSLVPTKAATTFAVSLVEGAPPALAQPVFRRWTSAGWVPAP